MKEIILLSLEVIVAILCGAVGILTLCASFANYMRRQRGYYVDDDEPIWMIYGVLLTLACAFILFR